MNAKHQYCEDILCDSILIIPSLDKLSWQVVLGEEADPLWDIRVHILPVPSFTDVTFSLPSP